MRAVMTKRATEGRYQTARSARGVGDHLPREGVRSAHLEIRHAVVDDPNPTFRGEKQRVAVNLRTDALESEYAYGRISEAAYRAGRVYQAVLERATSSLVSSTWNAGDRVDAAWAVESRIIRSLKSASDAVALLDELRPIIGLLGERVLFLSLMQRLTLTDLAAMMSGRKEKRVVTHYSWLFRQALELVAEHWGKTAAPRA